MKTLGAVLAGGQSSRFGSDKAEAQLWGLSLIEHGVNFAKEQCDAVVVVGRPSALAIDIPDWPGPGMGPLSGFAGALRYAATQGFDQVMTLPVDCPVLPDDLRLRLEPAPAYCGEHPVIGLWRTSAIAVLSEMLLGGGSRSVRAFADRVGAGAVHGLPPIPNLNYADDLTRLARSHDPKGGS